MGVAGLHACVQVRKLLRLSRCGFLSVRYNFGGKYTWQKRFGTMDSVRCPEFRGGRFSEVANVLQVSGFQSVTRTLSALGSVSASRSVRSGRFYCIYMVPCTIHTPHISVKNSIINGRLGVGSYHNNGFSIVIINIQVTITSNEDIMWRCIYRIRIFTIGSQSREMDVELQLTHTPPPETYQVVTVQYPVYYTLKQETRYC